MFEELHAQSPEDDTLTRDLGSAYSTAATTLLGEKFDAAALESVLQLHLKALALDRQIMRDDLRNYEAVRSIMADHINLNNLYNVMQRHAEADSHCREALRFSAVLAGDKENAQQAADYAQIEMHCARARRGLADMAAAERFASGCIAALTKAIAAGDNLQLQYTLGACEEVQASVHEQRASAASASRGTQLRELQRARELYASANSRIGAVAAAVTIDYSDRVPLVNAQQGLARSERRRAPAEGPAMRVACTCRPSP